MPSPTSSSAPTPLKYPLSNTPTPDTIFALSVSLSLSHSPSMYISRHTTHQQTPHPTLWTWTSKYFLGPMHLTDGTWENIHHHTVGDLEKFHHLITYVHIKRERKTYNQIQHLARDSIPPRSSMPLPPPPLQPPPLNDGSSTSGSSSYCTEYASTDGKLA